MFVSFLYMFWAYQTVIHTVTNTKCCLDTLIYPDDGQIVAQNM